MKCGLRNRNKSSLPFPWCRCSPIIPGHWQCLMGPMKDQRISTSALGPRIFGNMVYPSFRDRGDENRPHPEDLGGYYKAKISAYYYSSINFGDNIIKFHSFIYVLSAAAPFTLASFAILRFFSSFPLLDSEDPHLMCLSPCLNPLLDRAVLHPQDSLPAIPLPGQTGSPLAHFLAPSSQVLCSELNISFCGFSPFYCFLMSARRGISKQ